MPDKGELATVLFAQERATDQLFRYLNVLGTATGYRERSGVLTDELAVQVFVSSKISKGLIPDGGVIPRTVPGPRGEPVPTDVVEVGFFRLLQNPCDGFDSDHTRYRPVLGGCEIALEGSRLSGTMGAWVGDETDDAIVLLSNNHVLTNPSDRINVPVKDRLVQPWTGVDVEDDDVIGDVKRIAPILTSSNQDAAPTNPVDAGIGRTTASLFPGVIDIGFGVFALRDPTLDMNVRKRGIRTKLTEGSIVSLNATVRTNFGTSDSPAWARIGMDGSVFGVESSDGNPFACSGDSGSVVFDQRPAWSLNFGKEVVDVFPAVGLHFASNADHTRQFSCTMSAVFRHLQLATLCTATARRQIQRSLDPQLVDRRDLIGQKEGQLRELRDLMSRTPFGATITQFLADYLPALTAAMATDEEASGLAARALRPWIAHPTNFDIFEAEIDDATVENLTRLGDRLARLTPELAASLGSLQKVVRQARGKRVRDLLEMDVEKRDDG